MRVVSLLPSATEICYELGIEPVGISHECDVPPGATEVPSMNSSLVDSTGASAEINEQVVAAERDGGVYCIDHEALSAVDPDLIITQGVCDVCAVDRDLVTDTVVDLGLDVTVLTIDVHSLDDVLGEIRRIGEATGRQDRAQAAVSSLQERIVAVRNHTLDITDNRRVVILDWMNPIMIAGHWIPEMVELAGGQYGLSDRGARSVPRDWSEIIEYDPEVIIVAPCGFDIEQTLENANDLTTRDGWEQIAAVRDGEAYVMDGKSYVNRPGPRLVDTFEILASILHPQRFPKPPVTVARPLM